MSDMSSILNVTSTNIQDILGSTLSGKSAATAGASTDSGTFEGIYNAAINMISSTNDYLQDAQKAELAFAAGEITSTEELAVIEQKANLSLQYTVAVKNQLLSAYQEIMNMQI